MKKPAKQDPQAKRHAAAQAAAAARGMSVSARKDGMRRVYWSEEERELLAAETATLIRAGAASIGRPLPAMRAAQDRLIERGALAPERRRPIPALEPWMRPAIERQLSLARAEDATRLREQERSTRPTQERPPEPAPVLEPVPQPEPSPAQLAPTLAAAVGHNLRQLLVEELASIIGDAIRLAIGRHFETPPRQPHEEGLAPPPVRPAPAPHKPRQKSVLVVGLRGSQMELMKAEFGKRLDLRFHGANDSKDALRQRAASADVTIGFTDFLSHAAEATIKSRSPNYVRSGGGLSSLRSTLERVCQAPA